MKSFSLSISIKLEIHEKWKKRESLKHNLQHIAKVSVSGIGKHWLSQAHIYVLNISGGGKRWKCLGSAEIAPVGHIKTIKFSSKYLPLVKSVF